jgi:glucokinase
LHLGATLHFLGIEIGGTKLQLGIGPGNGTLTGLWRAGVEASAGAEGIRRQIRDGFSQLLAQHSLGLGDIAGTGIGFGGPVDDSHQVVVISHQIPGWDGFPLVQWMSDTFGLRAALGNDADLAGLAEARFGAGQGLSPIFYITIGSGIGGALIIDGDVYRGAGRGAGEIGHLRLTLRTQTKSEATVRLEDVASGWAIARRAREELSDKPGRSSALIDLAGSSIDRITTHHVAQAAAQADPYARVVLDDALEALAHGIAQTIVLVCPRRIIVGGGVSLIRRDLFLDPLRRRISELVATLYFPPFAGCYDIASAALGEQVVVHGGLALARDRFGKDG